MEDEKLPLLGAPRSARASRASRVSTAEEARLHNRGKRVKMHSKRLRQLWPQIVTFLALRDVVALASTCRRLQRLIQDDCVWQREYERVSSQHMTRLLLPHLTTRRDEGLPAREKLRRLLHARHVHDPTNALQLRLREAEREVFRLELWRRKVRSLVWVNAPLVLTLCCLSIWSYGILEDSAVPEPHRSQQSDRPPDQLRGSGEASSPSALVSPVKTFIVVADVLLLVALVVLSIGDLTAKALYTVGMLAAIEVAVMVAEFVAWSSPLQIAHSFLVLAMIVLNVVLAAKKKRAYLREVAAFASTY